MFDHPTGNPAGNEALLPGFILAKGNLSFRLAVLTYMLFYMLFFYMLFFLSIDPKKTSEKSSLWHPLG